MQRLVWASIKKKKTGVENTSLFHRFLAAKRRKAFHSKLRSVIVSTQGFWTIHGSVLVYCLLAGLLFLSSWFILFTLLSLLSEFVILKHLFLFIISMTSYFFMTIIINKWNRIWCPKLTAFFLITHWLPFFLYGFHHKTNINKIIQLNIKPEVNFSFKVKLEQMLPTSGLSLIINIPLV